MDALERVQRIAEALLNDRGKLTEADTNKALDDAVALVNSYKIASNGRWALDGLRVVLRERYCVQSKQFKVAAISENTNGFGLNQFIFVAQDGTAWQGCAAKAYARYKLNDVLHVRIIQGEPDFTSHGFEIPEPRGNGKAPPEVVAAIWK